MINLLIALISLFVIGFLAYRIWQIERKNIFWWALGFKLVCGILIGLMYQYYYTAGDTWTYYQESKNVI
jgi:biotin transporter BioY